MMHTRTGGFAKVKRGLIAQNSRTTLTHEMCKESSENRYDTTIGTFGCRVNSIDSGVR